MKPAHRFISFASITCLALAAGQLSGCDGGEEEVVAPPPAPAPSGPRYAVQDLPMNVKVQFPQKYAPDSEPLAQAVADFASALATGDASAFGDLLAAEERNFLQNFLLPSGQWAEDTQAIRVVRVVNMSDGESVAQVALAIGTDEDAYLTAWNAQRVDGDNWQFAALPVAPRTTTRVVLLDDAAFDEDALGWLRSWGDAEDMFDPYEEEFDFEDTPSDSGGDDFTPPPNPGSPSSPSSPSSPGAPASPFG